MALLEREVGIAIAATATALSPRARELARQGAVYGLAGMLKAGDVVVGTARGAARGAAEGLTSSDGPVSTAARKVANTAEEASEHTSAEPVRRRSRGGTRRQEEEEQEETA